MHYNRARFQRGTRFLHFFLISTLLMLIGLSPWPSSAPVQAASSGTPILLIVNQAAPNRFGRYLVEILRAEGLVSYDIVELSTLTSADLLSHDVAILAETSLSSAQANLLSSYVQGGGGLLAMRPDPQIASLFGLSGTTDTLSDAYVQINTAQPLGSGLSNQTLQTHTVATKYTSVNSTPLAQLYSAASAAANAPAVVRSTSNRTAAFTYDLATAVIGLRQGNPANADVDVDNDGMFRTTDLFQSPGGGSPWINLDRLPVPQADEQQRLFARLVKDLIAAPTPQLWYFPAQAKTVLVLTGDAHANPLSYYQLELNSLTAHNAPITLYLTIGGGMTDTAMQAFRAQGHEFGIHPYTVRPDSYPPYNITNLTEGFQVFNSWYSSSWSSPPSRSYRTHRLGWQGWADAAAIAATHGYALDTNFYHWGTWLRKSDGAWPLGYLTGSGQPMKFVQPDGTIIPVYQQLTQLVDEFLLTEITSGYQAEYGWVLPQYDAAQALAASKALIDASTQGDYAALMTQFHTDYYGLGDPQVWAEGLVDYAHTQQIPVWNADTFLQFVETRAATSYTHISWQSSTGALSFSITGPSAANTQLSTMLPLAVDNRGLASVSVDGNQVSWSVQTIKGQQVAFVSIPAGNHSVQASYQVGVSTPTRTPTSVTTPTPTAPINTATATATPILPTNTPTQTPTLSAGSPFVHTTLADFSQPCSVSSQVQATLGGDAGDGALTLSGANNESFDTATLDPALWTSGSWNGGSYTPGLANSLLSLAGGGFVRSTNTAAVTELEVTATFGAGPWQHVGLASLDFAGDRYAIFSTYNSSNTLYARVNNGNGEQQLNLGPIPSGSHQYRIVRRGLNASTDLVSFLIDNSLQGSFTVPNTGLNELHSYLSNNGTNAAILVVDQLSVSPPVLTSGSFISCVLDAGASQEWNTISWQAILPTASSLQVAVRTSNDGQTWSSWTPIAASGTNMPGNTRYAQYQLSLATTDPQQSPLVLDVSLTRGSGTATSTPTATSTTLPPTSTPTTTSTALPPTSTPTTTSTALPPTSTPTATSTTLPPTSTPTATSTPTPLPALLHTTLADFSQSCSVSTRIQTTVGGDAGDGAVILGASLIDDFTSLSLDTTRWTSGRWWSGGYWPNLSNSLLYLPAGSYVRSYSASSINDLDVTVSFINRAWMEIGLGSLNFSGNRYALFSTYTADGNLYAIANNGSGEQRLNLGSIPSGSHRYKIVRRPLNSSTDQISYLIDGTLKGSINLSNTGLSSLYMYLSNYSSSGTFTVDRVAASPPVYTSGTYTSCALDAGAGQRWSGVSWNATLPTNTSLVVRVRTSNDASTWSTWSIVSTSGATVPTRTRYIQYRLTLNTGNTARTPLVSDITLTR